MVYPEAFFPMRQGLALWQSFMDRQNIQHQKNRECGLCLFFDTVVLCSLTALVILCTTQGDTETLSLTGAALAAACFSAKLGVIGEWFISISMVVFAFATVIAWYYLGQQAIEDLSLFSRIYPVLFLGAVFAGGCIRLEAVWMLSDLWNGLMAFFNLTALLFLTGEVEYPDRYI